MKSKKEILSKIINYNGLNDINYISPVNKSVVLYPLYASEKGYVLSKKIWKILQYFLEEINEIEILLTEIEIGLENIQEKNITLLKKGSSYEEYLSKEQFFLENIIYSTKGEWYIFLNSDLYGILVGTEEKVKIFKKYYNDWKIRTILFQRFLLDYSSNKEHLIELAQKLWDNETELSEKEKYAQFRRLEI